MTVHWHIFKNTHPWSLVVRVIYELSQLERVILCVIIDIEIIDGSRQGFTASVADTVGGCRYGIMSTRFLKAASHDGQKLVITTRKRPTT